MGSPQPSRADAVLSGTMPRVSIAAFACILCLPACDPSGDTEGSASGTDGATGSTTASTGEEPTTTAAPPSDETAGPADGSGSAGSDDGPMQTCGNGQLDADEVCDGEAGLEGQSCASLGYVAGQLGCAPDCSALDESGCSATAICGDGEVSEGEACEPDLGEPQSCGAEGSGDQTCLDCQWSVSSCCSASCTEGCDDSCGADPNDLSGTWTIHFINNGWEGPDPTMIMELAQEGTALSGSFTTDAWYLGDHDFEGGERDGNSVYMHVPITQLADGMIMEGTVCGGCSMIGVTDPQGGLDSDWVATRDR